MASKLFHLRDDNFKKNKVDYFEAFNNGVYEDPSQKYTDKQAADLLLKYLEYQTLGFNHINTYNYWIKENAENNIIQDKELIYEEKDGTKIRVYFENLKILNPTRIDKGMIYRLTPEFCRKNNMTYYSEWWIDFVKSNYNTGEIIERKSHHLANIPVMLKSSLCTLRGLTEDQLIQCGEDPDDCGGYFIINGSEKVLMFQEKMSLQKVFVIEAKLKNKNKNIDHDNIPKECRTTVLLKNGKTVVCSLSESKDKVIEYKLVSIKSKEDVDKKGIKKKITTTSSQQDSEKINVLRIYRLLGITNSEDIDAMIGRYIPEKYRNKCLDKLIYSKNDIHADNNDFEIIRYKISKNENIEDKSNDEIMEIIENKINLDLFPNLDNPLSYTNESLSERKRRTIIMKLQTLSAMIAKYLEVLCKFREVDDRDSWSNKLIEGAGNLMEKLLKTSWENSLNSINEKISNRQITQLNEIIKSIGKDITDDFQNSFVQPEWGVKGKSLKKNITQILNRDSIIAMNSHLANIDVSVSRTDNLPKIRVVQNSQFPIVCPVTTAEGENCGIIKNISILTYVSLPVSDYEIKRFLIGDSQTNSQPRISIVETEEMKDILYLNGFMGYCNAVSLKKELIERRRIGSFPIEMSVIHEDDILHIDLSPCRPMSPFLIVDDDQELVIDKKNMRDYPMVDLINSGCIEYISSWEQESIKLATNPNNIYERKIKLEFLKRELEKAQDIYERVVNGERIEDSNGILYEDSAIYAVESASNEYEKIKNTMPYTHCMFHGAQELGIGAVLVPLSGFNQAPRNVYQVNMGKQAVGVFHSNHLNRYDGKSRVLAFPTAPIGNTILGEIIGINKKSQGQTVTVAFGTYEHTQEDAFVMKDEALQAGMFRNYKYIVYSSEKKKNIEAGIKEEYCLPSKIRDSDLKRYRFIQENGLPAINAFLSPGDCVIGKVETITENGEKKQINRSTFLKIGESGIVTKVLVTANGSAIYVKLRLMRIPREGDKFAPRCAQKGTIGKKYKRHLMPCSIDTGVIPDIFVNTHCITTRMTISYLIEVFGTKAAAMIGDFIDFTFPRIPNIELFSKILQNEGLDKFGYEKAFSGITGEEIENKIFMGPVYFQTLKHQVADKIQARGTGVVKPGPRQPLRGRGQGGGIRFGEMERDCTISHGSSAFARERLCLASDQYKTVICIVCGDYAVNYILKEKYICKACGNEDQNKFGKTTIPYVFKYFQHILSAASIKLRPIYVTLDDYKKELLEGNMQNISEAVELDDEDLEEDGDRDDDDDFEFDIDE